MGYKMKKFSGFGNEKKSPAKVSDKEVIAAQKKLDEIELAWKEPGWAKVAGKLHDPFGILGGGGKGKGKGGAGNGVDVGEASNAVQSVAELSKDKSNLEGGGSGMLPEDYKLGDLGGGLKL